MATTKKQYTVRMQNVTKKAKEIILEIINSEQ